MIPSTHAVLVYRRNADRPDSIPWGNIYEEFKHDPAWLKEVETALLQDEQWESAEGRDGILKIAQSRIWQE